MLVEKNYNFRYDNFNQLREVVTPDGEIATYTYNGDGLRASKNVDGDITNFIWDGQDVILETGGNGVVKAKNFFGLDLVSRQTADDIYYYLFNGHGDVTSLVNDLGEVVKDYTYDPFGKEIKDKIPLIPGKTAFSLWMNEVEKIDNPFQYAGEYLDSETGNYYLRARYYDLQIQRFISEDSYARIPGWDEHIYAYVNYNPVNFIDPSGHRIAEDSSLSKGDQKLIDQYTRDYNNAKAKNDIAGMQLAHDNAVAVRLNSQVYEVVSRTDYKTRQTGQIVKNNNGLQDDFIGEMLFYPGGIGTAALGKFVGKGIGKFTGELVGRLFNKIDDIAKGMGKAINLDIKPNATLPKLRNVIEDLYKGQKGPNRIGNGTTMDAIRNELKTGQPTHGTFHSIKGEQYSNALQSILRRKDLSSSDRVIAEALLKDLKNALSGK